MEKTGYLCAINTTDVTVEIAELTEDITDATVEVVDPNGTNVEVVAKDVTAGSTEVTFDFVTALDEVAEGTWSVDGLDYEVLGAEALVEEYEAVDPEAISSYDEVESVNAKETAAREAVESLSDEVKKNELTGRINEQAALIEDALQVFVDAVNNAGNQQELLAALEDFFMNAEQEYIVAYDYLVNTGDPITGDPIETNTVQDIQENIVDYAPEVIDEIQTAEEVVDAVYEAVDSENEFNLESTLEFYQGKFERLVFDADHIAKYMDTITVDFDYTSAADELVAIQGEIDSANQSLAGTAVTTAEAGIDRAELNYASELVANLSDEFAGKEALQTRVDDHDLILDVNEARTTSAMADALAALEDHSDYTSNEFDVSEEASVLADYVDAVQDATVTDDDINTIAGANGGIKGVIEAVNVEFSHFEVAELTTDTSTVLEFTINALDKIGNAYTVPASAFDVDVTVGENEETVAGVDFNGNASETVTTTTTLAEVGEYVATLEFTLNDVNYSLNGDVIVEADPTADSTVETDATEYVSGDNINATVTLRYAADKVLTTVDGTYSATVTIGSDTYNKELDFTDGVADLVVEARSSGTNSVDVNVPDVGSAGTGIISSDDITIEAGAPAELDVTADTTVAAAGTDKTAEFTITVTDGLNTVTDYEGTKTAQVTIYNSDDEVVAPQAVVDYTGSVNLDFTAGGSGSTIVDFTDLLAEYDDVAGLSAGDTVEFEIDGIKGSAVLEETP